VTLTKTSLSAVRTFGPLGIKEVQLQLYASYSSELVDISGLELKRARVVATAGDLKETQLNPSSKFLFPVWFTGLIQNLQFDPGEWH
jgi:hypothetical protein